MCFNYTKTEKKIALELSKADETTKIKQKSKQFMRNSGGQQSVESPKQKFCVIYRTWSKHFTGLGSHVEGQCDNIDSGAIFCPFPASSASSAWLNLGLKPVIPRTGAEERKESTGLEHDAFNTDSSCIYFLSLPSRK